MKRPRGQSLSRSQTLRNEATSADEFLRKAQSVLQETFGFSQFRGNQADAIVASLEGRDCFVLMPTGGGKTMCYTIPALVSSRMVVVVSPLIALMQDQVGSLRANGVMAAYLASSLKASERQEILDSLDGSTGCQPSILYVTPELLATGFKTKLSALHKHGKLGMVAVDEAHCISSWGHDFRPAYRQLCSIRQLMPGLPIMALTATADAKVQGDIIQQLHLHQDCVKLLASFNRPNITYSVIYLDVVLSDMHALQKSQPESAEAYDAKDYDMVQELVKEVLCKSSCSKSNMATAGCSSAALASGSPLADSSATGGCCIIYVHKRDTADELAAKLVRDGFRAAAYSAKLSGKDRTSVLERWQAKQLDVVVATVAFGMGIDRGDVRLVLHYNLPKTVEGFYQESGRGGRDGLPARSVLFYSLQDRSKMDYLLQKGQQDEEKKKKEKSKKRKAGKVAEDEAMGAEGSSLTSFTAHARRAFGEVIKYCTSRSCLRAFLLAHFGETLQPGTCSGCAVCQDPQGVTDSQEALKHIEQTRLTQRANHAWHLEGSRAGCFRAGTAYGAGYTWKLDGSDDEMEMDKQPGEDADGGLAFAAPRPIGPPVNYQAQQAAAAASRAAHTASSGTGHVGSEGEGLLSFLDKMEALEERYEKRSKAGTKTGPEDVLKRLESGRAAAASAAGSASSMPGKPPVSAALGAAGVRKIAEALKGNTAMAGLPTDVIQSVSELVADGLLKEGASKHTYAPRLKGLVTRCMQAASIYDVPDVLEACNKQMKQLAEAAQNVCTPGDMDSGSTTPVEQDTRISNQPAKSMQPVKEEAGSASLSQQVGNTQPVDSVQPANSMQPVKEEAGSAPLTQQVSKTQPARQEPANSMQPVNKEAGNRHLGTSVQHPQQRQRCLAESLLMSEVNAIYEEWRRHRRSCQSCQLGLSKEQQAATCEEPAAAAIQQSNSVALTGAVAAGNCGVRLAGLQNRLQFIAKVYITSELLENSKIGGQVAKMGKGSNSGSTHAHDENRHQQQPAGSAKPAVRQRAQQVAAASEPDSSDCSTTPAVRGETESGLVLAAQQVVSLWKALLMGPAKTAGACDQA